MSNIARLQPAAITKSYSMRGVTTNLVRACFQLKICKLLVVALTFRFCYATKNNDFRRTKTYPCMNYETVQVIADRIERNYPNLTEFEVLSLAYQEQANNLLAVGLGIPPSGFTQQALTSSKLEQIVHLLEKIDKGLQESNKETK